MKEAHATAIHIPMKNRKKYVLPTHRRNETCSKEITECQCLTTCISNGG